VSAPILVAVAAFVACVSFGAFLWRSGRARVSFALLVAAPVVAAAAFAASTGVATGAADAHANADASVAPAAAPADTRTPAAPAAPVAGGSEIDGWRHAAEQLRRARRFAGARDEFAKVVKAAPMDADAWADLGDASAAAAGDDLNAGRAAIDRALQLDPKHSKALWLKASLELQEHRYPAAAALWQQLLAQLPAESNDARIVKANLDEARALAAQSGSR
jgi:cytochrome c-type biogenesis protein CcmH/NrfG